MRMDSIDSGKWTWHGFWARLHARQLGSKDFDALTWRLLIPILLPSGLVIFFLDGECLVGDKGGEIGLMFVTPLFALIFGWLSYCTRRSPGLVYKALAIVIPLIAAMMYGWMTLGYFSWANALVGPGDAVQVSGPVIEKTKGMGTRFSGYNYVVTVRFEDRPVCLNVSKGEYDAVPLGSVYGREMRRGGFGYFYQWK